MKSKPRTAKQTPFGIVRLGEVAAGDSVVILDGRRAMVAWQQDGVTMVRWPGDGPRVGPHPMPSSTEVAAVERRERVAVSGGGFDPVGGKT